MRLPEREPEPLLEWDEAFKMDKDIPGLEAMVNQLGKCSVVSDDAKLRTIIEYHRSYIERVKEKVNSNTWWKEYLEHYLDPTTFIKFSTDGADGKTKPEGTDSGS